MSTSILKSAFKSVLKAIGGIIALAVVMPYGLACLVTIVDALVGWNPYEPLNVLGGRGGYIDFWQPIVLLPGHLMGPVLLLAFGVNEIREHIGLWVTVKGLIKVCVGVTLVLLILLHCGENALWFRAQNNLSNRFSLIIGTLNRSSECIRLDCILGSPQRMCSDSTIRILGPVVPLEIANRTDSLEGSQRLVRDVFSGIVADSIASARSIIIVEVRRLRVRTYTTGASDYQWIGSLVMVDPVTLKPICVRIFQGDVPQGEEPRIVRGDDFDRYGANVWKDIESYITSRL